MRLCNVAGTDDHARGQYLQLGRVGTVWSNARRRSYQLAAKPHEWMIFRQLRRIAFAPLVQGESVTMRRLANQFYDWAGIDLGAVAEFNAGGGFRHSYIRCRAVVVDHKIEVAERRVIGR